MNLQVYPKKLIGKIIAPPSKSYFQRAIILACFANKKTKLLFNNNPLSKDIIATIEALKVLGALIEPTKYGLLVFPIDKKNIPKKIKIDVIESGATLRFLIPIVSALNIETTFIGSGSILNRPFDEYINALKGVLFSDDKLPFTIYKKADLSNIHISCKQSSQYLTGLLLAICICGGKVTVDGKIPSSPYVDLTLDLIKKFGVKLKINKNCYYVEKPKIISPKRIKIEGDYSSCAFYSAVNKLGGKVVVKGLNKKTKQGDKKIDEILTNVFKGDYIVDCDITPDLTPILAVVSSFTKNKITFTNIERLKTKESDRVLTIKALLEKLGVKVNCNQSKMVVLGQGKIKGGEILQTFNDHRIVEASVLASLFCERENTIKNAESVDKSYANFFEDIKSLGGKINVI